MSTTSIIVKNLRVNLQGNTVLEDVSFSLYSHQHLAITGESGSGKTVLAKALTGQLFYTGTVEISAEGMAAPRILLVEQRAQFKNLSHLSSFYYQQRFNSTESEDAATVEQELQPIAEEFLSEPERSKILNHWLHRLNLQHRKHTPLIQLSNGEHKRLQLIKALLQQPQVLILDQPFTGLDVQSREELHKIINHLSAETRMILITHSYDLPDCITHVAQLHAGKWSMAEKKDVHDNYVAHSFLDSLPPLPVTEEHTYFSTAVQLVNVSVRYGEKKILQHINWQVARGERWLLKGPNGAGKSTLLSLLTGDNPQAYANEIYLFDRKRGTGESIWDIKKRIGYISPELHWHFDKGINVQQAVASGFFDTMGLYRILSAEQENTLRQWLHYFQLNSVQQKPLHFLSSGQQRLVLLARALVKNPPLLILDEPCQGLDDYQTADFTSLIDELCIKTNKTLIYVSHYDHEVPACVDKKIELNSGIATIMPHKKKSAEAA